MTITRTHTRTETKPCGRCGHDGSFHRHNDDLAGPDCHGPDGNYQCAHFRCLHPWDGTDYAPDPVCECPNFEKAAGTA